MTTEFTNAGDLDQTIAIAAYDKRVEVLESALARAMLLLQGKNLTPEEVMECTNLTKVLNP